VVGAGFRAALLQGKARRRIFMALIDPYFVYLSARGMGVRARAVLRVSLRGARVNVPQADRVAPKITIAVIRRVHAAIMFINYLKSKKWRYRSQRSG
jgi:hypothetical protein